MIITRTPFRVSFFGGGTDYPAWFQRHGGVVLATSIDKYCYITCRYLPPFFEHKYRIVYSRIENVQNISEIQHPAVKAVLETYNCTNGLEIHHDGDLPARSGLGSSSSFTVGLINAVMALRGQYISKEELARQAIHVEQTVIRENVGSQDQVSAAFGGLNRIEFRRDGSFDVAPIVLPIERLAVLQSHLMLCFTGLSRIASEVAQSTIDNMDQREAELRHMGALVDQAIAVLQSKTTPIEEFGQLLHESWAQKRKLSDRVSTGQIDALYDTARSLGAIGGKLLGAGGGGFFLLFVKPEHQQKVREKLSRLVHAPFRFETAGSRVVLYQPSGL
jgi:D-glycero-alpha-D-manno-heptose-7-phosphate kinase